MGFPEANIVACGDEIDPASVRKFDEATQFDSFIAPDAGIGRCAFEIAGNEVVDDPGAEGFSGVDYLMRDLEGLRDIPCNADLAAPTLFPTLRRRDRFVFVLPYLKGHAMNVVALANQKRCCDRAIHSTAHTEKNRRTSHTVAIVLKEREKGLEG